MAGKVVVVIRAYPKEVMQDFSELIKELESKITKDRYTIMKWEPVDIAFGYKAIDIYFLMPEDVEGGTEEIEEIVKSLDAIDNIDVMYVSRIEL